MKQYKVCMSVAGSDPSGGAGIQADLKTFTILGCYGQAVPTALTVQCTRGVSRSVAVDADLVYAQMECVMSDWPPLTLKIGMLPNAAVVRSVVRVIRKFPPRFIVLDPVMVSSSGRPLMQRDAMDVLRTELMPLCSLITPNIPEAQVLLADKTLSQEESARVLSKELGGIAVLVKGGHRADTPTDVLYDGDYFRYEASRVQTANSHGTGCVLSSAIAAYVCRGYSVRDAIGRAKAFLHRALSKGAAYRCGNGSGPVYLLPDETDAEETGTLLGGVSSPK